MALRFETQYKTKRLDNLGDPEWHNRRWQDIDRRMHARELDATKIDDAVDDLEAAALARLNDQLTPIIAQAITRLTAFGLLFSATSHSERTMATGSMQFLVDEQMRLSYVATGFTVIKPVDDPTIGMSARTIGYNRDTGVLDVEVYSVIGSGTYDHWTFNVTGDPDLSHALRTDNPHQTTAPQVGAYTRQQVDDAIAGEVAARNAAITDTIDALIAGAPGALDTLNELAAALGDDANFAASVTNALAAKADLASPALTGDPRAPTPATADDDTSIATTAFVKAAIAADAGRTRVLLATLDPSGTTGVAIASTILTSGYDVYEIEGWIGNGSAAAAAVALYLSTDNGATFWLGANDYQYSVNYASSDGAGGAVGGPLGYLKVSPAIPSGNAAAMAAFVARIYKPVTTGRLKNVHFQGSVWAPNWFTWYGSGTLANSTLPINGAFVQLSNTGLIGSGSFVKVYGLK